MDTTRWLISRRNCLSDRTCLLRITGTRTDLHPGLHQSGRYLLKRFTFGGTIMNKVFTPFAEIENSFLRDRTPKELFIRTNRRPPEDKPTDLCSVGSRGQRSQNARPATLHQGGIFDHQFSDRGWDPNADDEAAIHVRACSKIRNRGRPDAYMFSPLKKWPPT